MSRLLLAATAAELDEMLAVAGSPVLLAGGTDLLVQRRAGRDVPEMVDASNLRDAPPPVALIADGQVRLSATAPLSAIAAGLDELAALDPAHQCPALQRAIAVFASAQIRNRATIGGNLGTASPSGDLMPPLVAADAAVQVRSAAGRRKIPIGEFLLGPRRTDLRPGEWIESVTLRPPADASGFRKVGGRRALAISVVNLAWQWTIRPGGTLDDVRLAVGSAAPTVVRCPSAERELTGARPARPLADRAAAALAADLSPIDDLRGSADYRRRAAGGLLLEALWPLLADADPASAEAGRTDTASTESHHHGREIV